MFDILIKNGTVCDGTGAPCFRADIGVSGDRIAYVGTGCREQAARIIDAAGKVVTPGFIDSHTHADVSALIEPAMEPFVKQGVTTVVAGNCGYGMAPQGDTVFYYSCVDQRFQKLAGAGSDDVMPLIYQREKAEKAFKELYGIDADWKTFDEYSRKCDAVPLGCNMAMLLGYNAARTAVMGKDCLRDATEEELERLEQAVRAAMEAGAFGMSTGRDPAYLPGPYAADGEIRQMLNIVKEYDGIFASHTANYDAEGNTDRIGGYEEMLRQAEGTGVKVHVSHVHALNMADDEEGITRAAQRTLDFFEEARRRGTDLSYDVIPSPNCCNFTLVSFAYYLKPLVLRAGGFQRLVGLLKTEAFRQELHQMLDDGKLPSLDINAEDNLLPELCVLKHRNPVYVGKFITECAALMGREPFDAALDLLLEDTEMVADFISPFLGRSVDVFCGSQYAMPCSDGMGFSKETNLSGDEDIPLYPNSMNIGLIPRYLTRYGGERFERAVRQATGFPAERFGMKDRGLLREGYFADIVVLDRNRLRSFDEEENPLQDPEGIDYVIVNGQVELDPDGLTGAGAGRVLRKERQ